MLTIGDLVPEFTREMAYLDSITSVKKDDLKGKWTILFFYPEDFSFICPTEVTGYNEHLDEARELGAQIYGVSTDSADTHKAWIKELGIKYPLIADESGILSEAFGVLDSNDNRCNRATFIISPDLRIEFVMVTARNIGRSVKETMRILRAIHTGDSCPADWDPNEVS